MKRPLRCSPLLLARCGGARACRAGAARSARQRRRVRRAGRRARLGRAARRRRSHDGRRRSHRRRSGAVSVARRRSASIRSRKQEQVSARPVHVGRARSTCASRARNSPTFRAPSSACSTLPRTRKRDAPQLVVYYLGVPDTTPEFADAAELDASLDGTHCAGARAPAEARHDDPQRAGAPARSFGAEAGIDRGATSAPAPTSFAPGGSAIYCVQPCWVTLAAGALAGTDARVVSVVGFPHGCDRAATSRRTRPTLAVADGAARDRHGA